MRYFKELDANGKVIAFGAGDALNGIDIGRDEYMQLQADFEKIMELARELYYCKITLLDVPEEWREDVATLADEMSAKRGAYDPNKIAGNEALDIILGVTA